MLYEKPCLLKIFFILDCFSPLHHHSVSSHGIHDDVILKRVEEILRLLPNQIPTASSRQPKSRGNQSRLTEDRSSSKLSRSSQQDLRRVKDSATSLPDLGELILFHPNDRQKNKFLHTGSTYL